jgi:hypothetical protein
LPIDNGEKNFKNQQVMTFFIWPLLSGSLGSDQANMLQLWNNKPKRTPFLALKPRFWWQKGDFKIVTANEVAI